MAQTDKFRKIKSLFSTTLQTGIGTGTGDTITLGSTAGLPTDTEITLTFNRVDSDGEDNNSQLVERITGTVSGATLTSYTRGVDGTVEQAHGAGTVVESIWIGDDWNDAVDGILVEHSQDGTLTNRVGDDDGILTGTAGTDGNLPKWNADGDIVDGYPTTIPVVIQLYDGLATLSTGDGKAYFTVPAKLNGLNLTAVHARVITAPTGASLSIQVRNVTDTVDMLSTALTIDATETGSDTAATAAVIDTDNDDVATNDLIAIDIDQVGSTVPGAGLIVRLEFDLA